MNVCEPRNCLAAAVLNISNILLWVTALSGLGTERPFNHKHCTAALVYILLCHLLWCVLVTLLCFTHSVVLQMQLQPVCTHVDCVCLVVCPEHWWWAGHLDDLQLPATCISGGLQDLHVAAGALVLQHKTAAAAATGDCKKSASMLAALKKRV
jgi:hypothetical protein